MLIQARVCVLEEMLCEMYVCIYVCSPLRSIDQWQVLSRTAIFPRASLSRVLFASELLFSLLT